MVGPRRGHLPLSLDLLLVLGRDQGEGPLRNTVQAHQGTVKAEVNDKHLGSELGSVTSSGRQEECFGGAG